MYHKNADLDKPDPMRNVGSLDAGGRGASQGYAEAMTWYHKAADLGIANTIAEIGGMYDKNQSTPQDFAEAMTWLRKAADLGDATAMRDLHNISRLYDIDELDDNG